MNDFIEALKIFLKYVDDPDDHSPFHCEHDTLYVCGIDDETIVSEEDVARLDDLGFFKSEDVDEGWISYRYGSC